mgnify:CR=1 FL=1
MARLVFTAGRRALWRHPVQLALALIGIAIGVAVVVAVDLANHSARQAMAQAIDRVAGQATHQVVAGPGGLPESLYRELRVEARIARTAPVVEGGATLPDYGGRPLRLMGLDPFAEAPFRDYLSRGAGVGAEWGRLLVSPDALVLPEATAEALALSVGDELRLRTRAGTRELTLARLIPDGQRDLSGLAFGDIAAVQEWLGRTGSLTRIDLILPESRVEAVRQRLPKGAALIPAAKRGSALAQMSQAFHINLTALSLLALVVGLFLVFNTMSFLVVQRRRMLGVLRTLGVTRVEVFAQLLADAVLIGVLGTALGLGLGVLLGAGVTQLVLATVDQLYFEAIGGLRLDGLALAKGGALGLVGTLLAACPAAWEAAGVSPRDSLSRHDLERRARRMARGLVVVAALLAAVAALVLGLLDGLVAGFAGIFALMLAVAALVPMAVVLIGTGLGRLPGVPLAGRLCLRGAVGAVSRTGIAVAALTVAVAAVIGMSVMIASFRGSVADWLERTLRADYYVSAPAPMPAALAAHLAAVDGVDHVTRSRYARMPSADGLTRVRGIDMPRSAWARFDFVAGDADRAWQRFRAGEGVLVSEPYARRHDVWPGDTLELPVTGATARTVLGVFRDYASVQGVVVMPLGAYRGLFDDKRLSGIGIEVAEGADTEAIRSRLQAALDGVGGARLRDNDSIRERSLAVFDQTFRVTSVLRLLAALVAVVGIVGALMALQFDRAREYATYRALGLTRGQLGAMTLGESGFLGTLAGLCAVPLGLLLAALLVFVINRRAFGWTMDFQVPPLALIEGVGLAVGAALVAALYPAWVIARRSPAAGLKED